MPFIANEGVAIEWLKGYAKIQSKFSNFTMSANSEDFVEQTSSILDASVVYLPNIYVDVAGTSQKKEDSTTLDIGCFGAVRPLKNHLLQAVVAMMFAEYIGKPLRFHINSDRIEQKGESIVRNLISLFKDTPHELVEHHWMNHDDFIKLVRLMDLGMQVSFSETFNIVAADFVVNDIPMIGSPEIDWLSGFYQASLTDYHDIFEKLLFAYKFRKLSLQSLNKVGLNNHNKSAVKEWLYWLG
jgi:hypothetical protein